MDILKFYANPLDKVDQLEKYSLCCKQDHYKNCILVSLTLAEL